MKKLISIMTAIGIFIIMLPVTVFADDEPMSSKDYRASQAWLISQYVNGRYTWAEFQEQSKSVTDRYLESNTVNNVISPVALTASNSVTALVNKIGSVVMNYGDMAYQYVYDSVNDFMSSYEVLREESNVDRKGYGALLVEIRPDRTTYYAYCEYILVNDSNKALACGYTQSEYYYYEQLRDTTYYENGRPQWVNSTDGFTYRYLYGDVRYERDGSKAPTDDEITVIHDYDFDNATELYSEHYKENKEKHTKYHGSGEIRDDNLKRAKEKIFDIVLLNDFKYFITGTFAEDEYLDRTDSNQLIKPLKKYLENQVIRRGLQYVLTAERHKESNGIHIHALVNDVLPLTYSGRRLYCGKAWNEHDILKHESSFEKFKKIYNIDNWRWGWSTAIPCDNNKLRLARYVTKYITKDQKKIFGKYYWSSKNIEREPQIILARTDFCEVLNEEFTPKGSSYRFKYDSFFSELDIDAEQNTQEILNYLADHERIQGLQDIQG